MRFVALLLLAVLAPLAWAGWARVEAPGGKLDFDAYSVHAPLGEGWMVNRAGPYDVGFGAMLSKTYTWSLTAAAIPLPRRFASPAQLLEHVKAQFASGSDPLRFRMVESRESVEELRGAVCARTYYKAEDLAPAAQAGPRYIIEATQVTCMHPDEPQLGVELGYHERYLPGEKAGADKAGRLAAFGERFIHSVKFWRPVGSASTGR